MSDSVSTKGGLKKGVTVPEAITWVGKTYNRSLLLTQNLSLKYIFRSSIFTQAHTDVNFIETHFNFI
jgi:hypothetical protein